MVLEVGSDNLVVLAQGQSRNPIELTGSGAFGTDRTYKVAIWSENLNPAIATITHKDESFIVHDEAFRLNELASLRTSRTEHDQSFPAGVKHFDTAVAKVTDGNAWSIRRHLWYKLKEYHSACKSKVLLVLFLHKK